MFEITRVSADAAEVPETLGTKDKFWYGDQRFLFKMARPGTGEDWLKRLRRKWRDKLGCPTLSMIWPTGSYRIAAYEEW